MKAAKITSIRLFVDSQKQGILKLINELNLKIEGQDFLYLTKVMRLKIGDKIAIFNGVDGEFLAEITEISKKYLITQITEKTAELDKSSNITLAFALLKNVKNEFIATKATELGVANIQPLITKRAIVDKVNYERFFLASKEASEQCERNDLVKIAELKTLNNYLKKQNCDNKLFILCDETLAKEPAKASKILGEIYDKKLHQNKEIVIFVGPEGGFASEEFEEFAKLKNLHSISLGKQILRADTAIISAITLVQEFLG